MPIRANPKLLYVVTEDWLFCLHRLDLAKVAIKNGFEVLVATKVDKHANEIIEAGVKLFPLPLTRGFQNPFREIRAILELIKLYRREKPDIVHHVALKSIMYGSLGLIFAKVPAVANSVTGLGHVFSGKTLTITLACKFMKQVFRLTLPRKNSLVIFQNAADQEYFLAHKMATTRQSKIIEGSGVDIERFVPGPEASGKPVVLLASRMLWEKGVDFFVQASRYLKQKNVSADFVLAGMVDTQNPDGIPEMQLKNWEREGVIQWWGCRDDMPEVFAKIHIVVLPTFYGEGVPKTLLEAGACGKPIVATDVPGCREVVKSKVNGFLVSPKNFEELAKAIEILLSDGGLRREFGKKGRELVVNEFSSEKVTTKTIEAYQELLATCFD